MASSIISTTIDETYPVAGQDNDSQGFRDNFTIIKDNFAFAKSEIETLQDTSAKLNVDNNFNNNTQSQLNLKQFTVQLFEGNSAVNVDYIFTNGQFVSFQAQGDLTLNITGWPTVNQYAEIVFALVGNGSAAHDVTITSTWTAPGNSTMLADAGLGSNVIAVSTVTTTVTLVKAFTFNQGEDVYLQSLGTFTEV
jgi:hypothetical protein